jgi:hypothetical protein
MLIFAEGGKPENPEKTLEARERINNKLNSHEVPEPRIESTTHWDHSGERRAYYRNTTHASLCITLHLKSSFETVLLIGFLTDCSSPLGMEDRTIRNNDLSSSSSFGFPQNKKSWLA